MFTVGVAVLSYLFGEGSEREGLIMKIRYSMLPRCNPEDDYMVMVEQLVYNQNGEAVVANVYNKDGSIKVEVFLSDYLIKNSNHRFMYFSVDEKHYLTESYIVISSWFYEQLCQNEYLWSLVWHEIGHFHSLPYTLDTAEKQVSEQRSDAIKRGEVMLDEQIADLFAVWAVGKENMLKGLKWARKGLNDTFIYDEERKDLGLREYYNRIQLVKQLDEETALEKLTQLVHDNRLL